MPNFDGTGPQGMGPMTGRAQGRCNTKNAPGRQSYGRGWGVGFGRGRGFGRRTGFCPFLDQSVIDENDRTSLSSYEKELQEELKEVQSLLRKSSKK
jgi:hypothetical protein